MILDVLRMRYPDVKDGHQSRILVHHRAAGLQRSPLHWQYAE